MSAVLQQARQDVPATPVVFYRNAAQTVAKAQTRCSTCNLHSVCLPCGITGQDTARVDELVYTRRTVKRGEVLYRAGDEFHSIYAVRSGFFKTFQTLADGREQVTGFQMGGEVLGLDGIGPEKHECDAVALEDSVVCVIPFARLEALSRESAVMQRHFHKMLSREIVREHGVMLLLGSMRAEERLATFLINLSKRFVARGYSASEFVLRMTRDEIGSYLGLKLETVSRLFSRLNEEGLIGVQQKTVTIRDVDGLSKVVGRPLH